MDSILAFSISVMNAVLHLSQVFHLYVYPLRKVLHLMMKRFQYLLDQILAIPALILF